MVEKQSEIQTDEEMASEYDFSDATRGRYAPRIAQGSNLVVLDPDVADVFPDSQAVNAALRAIIQMVQPKVTV